MRRDPSSLARACDARHPGQISAADVVRVLGLQKAMRGAEKKPLIVRPTPPRGRMPLWIGAATLGVFDKTVTERQLVAAIQYLTGIKP